ncbi:hypothetical protein [Croceibacterium ferulae]|uniref:hypothetical protein n=1 Tax=Croceibacterium ferulae TaxID=1854641 RepID=UPI000EABF4B5|nr:hypothetical protein [Croceibacterium ferulae]
MNLRTSTAENRFGVVASSLVKLRGTCRDGQPADEALHTISAGGTHMGEVRAILIKSYDDEPDGHGLASPAGTGTVQDRFGLITVTIESEAPPAPYLRPHIAASMTTRTSARSALLRLGATLWFGTPLMECQGPVSLLDRHRILRRFCRKIVVPEPDVNWCVPSGSRRAKQADGLAW